MPINWCAKEYKSYLLRCVIEVHPLHVSHGTHSCHRGQLENVKSVAASSSSAQGTSDVRLGVTRNTSASSGAAVDVAGVVRGHSEIGTSTKPRFSAESY